MHTILVNSPYCDKLAGFKLMGSNFGDRRFNCRCDYERIDGCGCSPYYFSKKDALPLIQVYKLYIYIYIYI